LFDAPPPTTDTVEMQTRISQLESALTASRGHNKRMEATYDEISDAADALALAIGLDSDHIATIIRTATDRLKESPCPAK
jgi:hypothetical protein